MRGTDKVVLMGIATHADKYGGNAWPSIATLCGYANVNRRAVQNSIATLVELGLVEVTINGGGSKKTPDDRRPNLYVLDMVGVHQNAPGNDGTGVQSDTDRDAPESATGCSPVPDGVHPGAQERSLKDPELSDEPVELPLDADREAKKIVDDYWKWYRGKHGTDPIVGFMAYRGIVAKTLKAGHKTTAIKTAMVEMHDAGIPMSAEALDRQLTGRRNSRPKARPIDDDRGGPEGKVSGW